jgi:hypothetical protein
MSAQAVISCPGCLRQYAGGPLINGRMGHCSACKEYFTVAVVEGVPGGADAVVFDERLVPRYNFLADGCSVMTRNVCELLRLAKQPISIEAVREIVRTIPRLGSGNEDWRGKRCIETLDRAHYLTIYTQNWDRFRELVEYFLHYIPTRRLDNADMLKGAFAGVLGELEFDTPEMTPTKRGRLERWAARRGW